MVLDSSAEKNLPLYLRTHSNLRQLEEGRRFGHECLSPEVIADTQAGVGAHTLLAQAQRREAQESIRCVQHSISRSDRLKEEAMLGLVRKGLIAMPPVARVMRREDVEEPDIAPQGESLRLSDFGKKMAGQAYLEENGEALKPMRSQASLASSQRTVRPRRMVSSSTGTLLRDSAQAEVPHDRIVPQSTIHIGDGSDTNGLRQEHPSVRFAAPGPLSERRLRDSSQSQDPCAQIDRQPTTYTGDGYRTRGPGLVDNIDAQRRADRHGKRPVAYSLPDGCPPPPVPAHERAQHVSFEISGARYPSAAANQTPQMPQVPELARVAGTPSPSVSSLDSNQRFLKSAVRFGSTPDLQLNPPHAPTDPQPITYIGDGHKTTPAPHKQMPPIELPAKMTSKVEITGYEEWKDERWGYDNYYAEMRARNSHPNTPEKVPLRSMSEAMPSIANCEFVKFGGKTGTVPFGRPVKHNSIGHKGYLHAERLQVWIPEWRARAAEEEKQRQVREQALRPERARHLNANPPQIGKWDTRPFYDYPKEITPRHGPKKVVSMSTARTSPTATVDSDDLPLSELQRRLKGLKRDQPSLETLQTLSSTVTAGAARSASAANSSSAATILHSPKPLTTAQEAAVNGDSGETSSLRSRYKRKLKLARLPPHDSGLEETSKALLRIKAFSLSNLAKKYVRDSPKRRPRVVQPSEVRKSEQAVVISAPTASGDQVVRSSETQEPAKPPNSGNEEPVKKSDSNDSAYISMESGVKVKKEAVQSAACTALVVSARSAVDLGEGNARSNRASRIPVAVHRSQKRVDVRRVPRLSSVCLLSIALLALVFLLRILSLREYLMLLCLVLVVIYGFTGAQHAIR